MNALQRLYYKIKNHREPYFDMVEGEAYFEDIKIGEIFGVDGCFNILYKMDKDHYVVIADDWRTMHMVTIEDPYTTPIWRRAIVYRLTPEAQAMWAVPE